MDVNKILLNVVSVDKKHVYTHPKYIVESHMVLVRHYVSIIHAYK